jgi:hypothetical protein
VNFRATLVTINVLMITSGQVQDSQDNRLVLTSS